MTHFFLQVNKAVQVQRLSYLYNIDKINVFYALAAKFVFCVGKPAGS